MKNAKNHRMKFIKESILSNKRLFLLVLFTVFLLKASIMSLPIVIGKIIDQLHNGATSINDLSTLLGLFVVVLLTCLVFVPIKGYLLTLFVQKNILNKSIEWTQQIFNKEFSSFNNLHVGKIVNSIDRGISSHEKLLLHYCGLFIPVVVEMLISIGLLLYFGGIKIVALTAMFLLVHFLIVSFIIKKRLNQINIVNDSEDKLASELTESLSNGLIFKLEKSVGFVLKRLKNIFKQYADATIKLSFSGSCIDSIQMGTANLVTLVVIIHGSIGIFHNHSTLGHLVTMIAIVSRVTNSFNSFLQSKKVFDQFSVDIQELLNVLNGPNFTNIGKTLRGVSTYSISPFKLTLGKNSFQSQHSITFKKGDRVAIIGETGQGKTTLLEVLAGLKEKSRKHVSINSIPLNKISSEEHFDVIRYCPQDNYLISGKISESVFFNKELNDNQKEILQKLCLKESFFTGKKQVAEKGQNISGGEARRLALSRVLAKSGDIHIFDEPTSALDSGVSGHVWDAIFEHSSDSILICTTHDYDRLSDFNRIIEVDNGKIIEREKVREKVRHDF